MPPESTSVEVLRLPDPGILASVHYSFTIHSFRKYRLSIYSVLSTVLGTENPAVIQGDVIPAV